MTNETILIADDEAHIRELVQLYLERDGYTVITAVDGLETLNQVKYEKPDLLVLDLNMPEMDGWEVCRRVRGESNLPILMLTARDDAFDKVAGLEMGADDYLTKPFEPRELVARVRAILRRVGETAVAPTPNKPRQLGNVTINPVSREVTIAGQRANLRTKEFDLLLTMADHVNSVLSRDQLLNLVWGYEYYGETRTVDVHIAHLREHLNGSNLKIETVWGMGYKLIIDD
jgi:DNA-binding response OmpR family regulator